jgi:hypothetical protein
MIFRLVSSLQEYPFSIRPMVKGETPALRASSALLMSRSSLIFLRGLLLKLPPVSVGHIRHNEVTTKLYIYNSICQLFLYKLTEVCINYIYWGNLILLTPYIVVQCPSKKSLKPNIDAFSVNEAVSCRQAQKDILKRIPII